MTSSPATDTGETGKVPDIGDVIAAGERLKGIVRRTPLLESPLLNERLGGRLLLKAECLQITGSFKLRGAYNRISRIPEQARAAGVVAYSSGNHAQGVAMAARMLGIDAIIIMPEDAPRIKRENTRALGAEVVLYDRRKQRREDIGEAYLREHGGTLVRPYDDRFVIAGQGSTALEILDQAGEAGAEIDQIIAPCGGGGLLAGIALAFADRSPTTRIYGAEPEGFDDLARSLREGKRRSNSRIDGSICDAIMTPHTGDLTYPILARHAAAAFALSDEEVTAAMRTAFEHFKVVIEPGGAVALAAVLAGKCDPRGRTSVVVASGGNCDPADFARLTAGRSQAGKPQKRENTQKGKI